MRFILSKIYLFYISILTIFINLFIYSKDLIFFLFNKHNQILSEEFGIKESLAKYKRIAIVNIYPNQYSLNFITNLLHGFFKNKFYIIVVSNKILSSEQKNTLLINCHILIQRPNIGRDIGAYRLGLKYVQNKNLLKNIDHLVFANDSLFYNSKTFNIINDLMSKARDFSALFENHELQRHFQSFFLVFSKKILCSIDFIKFFNNYVPFSSRTHCIENFEKKLSKIFLNNKKYEIFVLFNSKYFFERLNKILNVSKKKLSFINILENTLIFNKIIKTKKLFHYLPIKLADVMEKTNSTHSLSMILNYLFNCPIKRDLSLRGSVSPSFISFYCSGFSVREKELIYLDLTAKGLISSFPRGTWRRQLLDCGII